MGLKKLLLFVGLSLVTGFIWARVFDSNIPQRYSDPQIPISQFDEMVSVDVIRNGDDIWIVDHKSGHLIFEFNRLKEQDRDSFREYSDLLLEASGNEAEAKSSLSYKAK